MMQKVEQIHDNHMERQQRIGAICFFQQLFRITKKGPKIRNIYILVKQISFKERKQHEAVLY
uniref:Uncharacterized protein n=1 Tax=Solanum tuberosum TaxID=4113 RepID=M1AZI9_SOLTU